MQIVFKTSFNDKWIYTNWNHRIYSHFFVIALKYAEVFLISIIEFQVQISTRTVGLSAGS